jgi:hypothetical protein
MAFRAADRVKETSTTTGTGTYSLAGAVTGFRTFVAGIGTTNRCIYCAEDGTDWEINEGVVTDATPDTLTRARLLASSTGSAINWPAGTRNLFCVDSAADRNPRTLKLTADHNLSSTTATAVTGLELTNLQPGTYSVQYILICQSGAATTGLGFGINFTGTHVRMVAMRRSVATLTTASNGLTEEESGAALTTGGVLNGWATKAESTTAPTMVSAGVGAINVDTMEIIEVLIEVSAAGNLELWHSSETAASTTVESGSSVICTRIDD